MREEQRRKITTITTSRTSSSYGASNNRSVLGYWVPLAITVTAASVALGAWLWSERDDEHESEAEAEQYHQSSGGRPGKPGSPHGVGLAGAAAAAGAAGLGAAAGYSAMSGGLPPGPGPAGQQPPPPGAFAPQPPVQGGFQGPPPGAMPPPPGGEAASFYRQENEARALSTGITTSQQEETTFGGWASKSLAAAGSMVQGAVKAVRGGDDSQQFSDQERWSEEADKPERTNSMSPRKSKDSLAAGAALGAAAGIVGARSLKRQGTAAEFYSGEVDAPRRSSVATRRRTVAVAVSAVAKSEDGLEVDAHQSILAQLPAYINPDTTRIIVLIYDADLHTHPLSLISRRASERRPSAPSIRSQSTSSYANINTPGANGTPLHTPGDFPNEYQNDESDDKGILAHVDPAPIDGKSSSVSLGRAPEDYRLNDNEATPRANRRRAASNEIVPTENPLDAEANSLFKTLYNQANALVDRDTSVLPFTSKDGHKHILRSVQPEVLYIQESLCGTDGSLVSELKGWVRSIVVVIGDEGGLGGLVDSDTEEETGAQKRMSTSNDRWWRKESVTGVGRGVSVVESINVGEDWRRRVNDEE